MALKIRLARGGAKKRPYYSVVVADARMPRDGRYIEKVGTYNPLLGNEAADRVVLNEERIKHWISKGAKPTDRVHRFLDSADILERPARNNPNKAQLGKKALERIEEKKQKEEEAKAAAEEAAAEAAPAEEAPAEEATEEKAE